MSRLVVAGLSVLLLAVAFAPAQAAASSPVQAVAPSVAVAAAPYLPTAAVTVLVQDSAPTAVQATCTADCGSDPDVSCTGSICTAVDRNCAIGERGYVSCPSETWCASPCPVCTDGQSRFVDTGNCCKDFLKQQDYQVCVNGQWAHQYYSCAYVPHCLPY